ncbi:uncharacterized protein BXZ73DRAFT_100288 [Epithele typhae]|uniref:uncharacterized protein n=1 Tax=Epithele typhae TaxID=378194 RepID=UPI0020074DEA|nr:uncharacterized protein BXZ73DRAFT_100288 [Epithele typhae]KAH9936873.1 hypothetical protein BXZ73DRAFT_100288 [Epithele typhae]
MLAAAFAAFALAASAMADQTILVGQTGGKMALAFSPNNINATKGEVITFLFNGMPGNHTVAQSSFATPCEPLASGFDSGYVLVKNGTSGPFPTFNLTITDETTPIWFYCAQVLGPNGPLAHCPAGMVGAINAPGTGDHVFASFSAAATQTPTTQPTPALLGIGASASASVSPTAATNVASNATSTGSSSTGSATSSGKSSAGTVVVNGALALVAAAFGVVLA